MTAPSESAPSKPASNKEGPRLRSRSKQELLALAEERGGLRVSIFLPTHGPGDGEQQDMIRLRNLLRDAERRLTVAGLRPPKARDLLAPGVALAEDAAFWQDAAGGIALLLAGDGRRHLRLPYHLRELVVVGTVSTSSRCCRSTAGTAGSTCWRSASGGCGCSRRTGRSCGRSSCPACRPAWRRRCASTTARSRSSSTRPARPGGRPAAMFHGHGVGSDDAKDRILRYFREVDRGVHGVLGAGRAPLVLAAVDYLRPLYRAASSHPHILEEGVPGNPDLLDPRVLHRRAWTLVRDRFRWDQQAAAARFRELEGGDRAASDLRGSFQPRSPARSSAAGPHGHRAVGRRGHRHRRGPAPPGAAAG